MECNIQGPAKNWFALEGCQFFTGPPDDTSREELTNKFTDLKFNIRMAESLGPWGSRIVQKVFSVQNEGIL